MSGPAQRTYEQVVAAKRAAEPDLLSRPGVTGVDVGPKYVAGQRTSVLAIRVYVAHKGAVVDAEAIPPVLGGVPTDVIEARPVRFEDATRYDPLIGGISVGSCRPDPTQGPVLGTLGMLVTEATTGALMALSNSHVFSPSDTGVAGDLIVQPGQGDGPLCPAPDNVIGSLVRHSRGGTVDAAVATASGRAATCVIAEIGPIGGTRTLTAAQVNPPLPVQKRGRTTGLTFGEVESVDATVKVDGYTFTNQLLIVPDTARNPQFADHGDSGSIIADGTNTAVGLLMAGADQDVQIWANPIEAVLSAMNVRLCMPATVLNPPQLVHTTPHAKTLSQPNRMDLGWESSDDYSGVQVRWGPASNPGMFFRDITTSGDGKSGWFTIEPLHSNWAYSVTMRGTRLNGNASAWSTAVVFPAGLNHGSLRAFLNDSGVTPAGPLRRYLNPGDRLSTLLGDAPRY